MGFLLWLLSPALSRSALAQSSVLSGTLMTSKWRERVETKQLVSNTAGAWGVKGHRTRVIELGT